MKLLLISFLLLSIPTFGQTLEVDGSVQIGSTENAAELGTIRWTGEDFEGNVGSKWISLTRSNDHPLLFDEVKIDSIILFDSL